MGNRSIQRANSAAYKTEVIWENTVAEACMPHVVPKRTDCQRKDPAPKRGETGEKARIGSMSVTRWLDPITNEIRVFSALRSKLAGH